MNDLGLEVALDEVCRPPRRIRLATLLLVVGGWGDRRESYSAPCSKTIRTARSRTSWENLVLCVMTPSSQEMESPANLGWFTSTALSCDLGCSTRQGQPQPVSMRSRVVLPAPLGPSRPTISPRPMRNETSASATKSPYRLPTYSASIIPSLVSWSAFPVRASAVRPAGERPEPVSAATPRRLSRDLVPPGEMGRGEWYPIATSVSRRGKPAPELRDQSFPSRAAKASCNTSL